MEIDDSDCVILFEFCNDTSVNHWITRLLLLVTEG